MEKYTFKKNIGEGAFGKVDLYQGPSGLVVIKKLEPFSEPDDETNFNAEVDILKHMKHPHIVVYIESFVEKDSGIPCIVMAYCEGGNLRETIADWKRKGNVDQSKVIVMFRQLCQAVEYVHSQKMMHRDIKPENIMISGNGDVKLGDFGISKVLKGDARYAKTKAGTASYMPPEVYNNQPYNNKCDIWSLGCVLYEMLVMKPAFLGTELKEIEKKVVNVKYDPIPSHVRPELTLLIQKKILVFEQRSRPSAAEILSLPIIKSV